MARDYYDILGLSKSASDTEIKSSYRKSAMKYHPDRNPGDKKAEEKFKEISEAYEVLKDPQKKAAYDQYGHAAFSQGTGGNPGGGFSGFGTGGFSDIFEDMFGMGGDSRRRSASTGSDLRYDLTVSLEQACSSETVKSYLKSEPVEADLLLESPPIPNISSKMSENPPVPKPENPPPGLPPVPCEKAACPY